MIEALTIHLFASVPVVHELLIAEGASPSPSPEFNKDQVTPGPVGFFAIAIVALLSILLIIDMNRRVRRVRYRAEVNEMLDAEVAAAALSAQSEGAGAESAEGAETAAEGAGAESAGVDAEGADAAESPHTPDR